MSTVSLVVNDKAEARIGEGTRQRVQQAVNELGYRTNVLARSLVRGHSPFIGLVADAISFVEQLGRRQALRLLVLDPTVVPVERVLGAPEEVRDPTDVALGE